MQTRRAFTFMELIVSMSLITLLVALLLPVFAHTRESARRSSCQSNLNQIVAASHLYAQDYNGNFPPNPDERAWSTTLQQYIKNWGVLTCPSEPAGSKARFNVVPTGNGSWGTSYRYAPGLGNDSPGETPLAWDWSAWHDRGVDVVFVDGHVKWFADTAPYSQGRERRPEAPNGGGE